MNKLTMAAFGLSLMIGSAFAAPPQTAPANSPTKKALKKKDAKTAHALTSASNPKPVVVKAAQ